MKIKKLKYVLSCKNLIQSPVVLIFQTKTPQDYNHLKRCLAETNSGIKCYHLKNKLVTLCLKEWPVSFVQGRTYACSILELESFKPALDVFKHNKGIQTLLGGLIQKNINGQWFPEIVMNAQQLSRYFLLQDEAIRSLTAFGLPFMLNLLRPLEVPGASLVHLLSKANNEN